jgi:hypothetical protein
MENSDRRDERREAHGNLNKLLRYGINVNRTSLVHLLLGESSKDSFSFRVIVHAER